MSSDSKDSHSKKFIHLCNKYLLSCNCVLGSKGEQKRQLPPEGVLTLKLVITNMMCVTHRSSGATETLTRTYNLESASLRKWWVLIIGCCVTNYCQTLCLQTIYSHGPGLTGLSWKSLTWDRAWVAIRYWLGLESLENPTGLSSQMASSLTCLVRPCCPLRTASRIYFHPLSR